MRQRANRATWVERIRSWKSSGKSADEFAAGQPYKPKTLTWWAHQLKHEIVGPRIEMARVDVRPALPSTIAIEVGGARVVVEHGFDETLLRAVVHALEGRK
jgi:hypothetical protein